jgi:hypothetical protein
MGNSAVRYLFYTLHVTFDVVLIWQTHVLLIIFVRNLKENLFLTCKVLGK